jgi:hypothetical protein
MTEKNNKKLIIGCYEILKNRGQMLLQHFLPQKISLSAQMQTVGIKKLLRGMTVCIEHMIEYVNIIMTGIVFFDRLPDQFIGIPDLVHHIPSRYAWFYGDERKLNTGETLL